MALHLVRFQHQDLPRWGLLEGTRIVVQQRAFERDLRCRLTLSQLYRQRKVVGTCRADQLVRLFGLAARVEQNGFGAAAAARQ